MLEPRSDAERATEEAVRRYLGRMALRYLPFTVALAIFVAMVIVVPTRTPSESTTGAMTPAAGVGQQVDGVDQGLAPSGGTGVAVGPVPPSGGDTAPVAPPALVANVGGPGKTINGSTCGKGVRQVPWTNYSALCVPRFTGNNGGATSYGVTGKTITATFRISNSGEAGALAAAAPTLSTEAQHQYFQDLSTFVGFFNTQFELYGRRLQVKEFTGQGDWVREYQAQNAQAAQADAATARSMGAFMDISSTAVSTTPLYAQYLASQKIISGGGVAASDHFFAANAPYAYALGASISRLEDLVPNVICSRMKGLPAIFSGDIASTKRIRKFGIIYPTNPDFQVVGKAVKKDLQACGTPIAVTYEYAIDLSTMASDSANAMAQMNTNGVTSVICLCDTVVPKFLTAAAESQRYHPEWIDSAGDSLAEGYTQSQWAHSIGASATSLPDEKSEAMKIYRLATHNKKPVSLYYVAAYADALLMFDALQNAGPHLTPATFQQGFFSLPSTAGGQLGPWGFGKNHYGPVSGAVISYYDPDAVSGQTGEKGANRNCSGSDGGYHPWEPRSAYGTPGTQLHCFGK